MQDIYQSLRTRLNTLPDKPPIVYFNQPLTDVSGIHFRESFMPAETGVLTFNGVDDNRGIYQVLVCAPKDSGTFMVYQWADNIMNHFPKNISLGACRVRKAYTMGGFEDGSFFCVPVTIAYRILR